MVAATVGLVLFGVGLILLCCALGVLVVHDRLTESFWWLLAATGVVLLAVMVDGFAFIH